MIYQEWLHRGVISAVCLLYYAVILVCLGCASLRLKLHVQEEQYLLI